MQTKTKHYINLTNGIEALDDVLKTNEPYSFLRVRSTFIECKNYLQLLTDLDHDFLLHLAMGYKCIFYDFGTNRTMSKTCYLGVPLIKYVLDRYWYDHKSESVIRIGRDGSKTTHNISEYFNHIYEEIFLYNNTKEKERLKTKLKYYKKFLNGKLVNLECKCESTQNDGNYPLYKELITNSLS